MTETYERKRAKGCVVSNGSWKRCFVALQILSWAGMEKKDHLLEVWVKPAKEACCYLEVMRQSGNLKSNDSQMGPEDSDGRI